MSVKVHHATRARIIREYEDSQRIEVSYNGMTIQRLTLAQLRHDYTFFTPNRNAPIIVSIGDKPRRTR